MSLGGLTGVVLMPRKEAKLNCYESRGFRVPTPFFGDSKCRR